MFLPSNITLKFGDSGDFVAELQRRLAMALGSNGEITGFYDGPTVNTVTQFQGMHGLHADGVAGPETLRRLNGVIAGDSSGGNPTEEEEKKKAASASMAMANFYQLGQEQLQAEQAMLASSGPSEAPPVQSVAPAELQSQAMQASPTPTPIPTTDPVAAMIAQAQQADAAQLQSRQAAPAPSAPAQDLMHMLMSAAPAAAPAMATSAATAELSARQQAMVEPASARPPEPANVAMERPVEAAAAPAAAPAGLMEKAIRFSSSAMQKLADYIESKLPASVLREVQQAGQIMAQAGMKESAIPAGPEMARAQEQLPQRAPEPQPQQTR